jgi:hypothetical protein
MGLYLLDTDGTVYFMRHKKTKKEMGDATRASVRKEMAKPRMSTSAKIAEQDLKLATRSRISR